MTETVPHLCVVCKSRALRVRSPGVTEYRIDCHRCGRYTISAGLDHRSRISPNWPYLKAVRRQIKPANARGNWFDLDTGLEKPLE